MSDALIRPAEQADLSVLIGTFGDEDFFCDRMARQHAGRGVLLTAWIQQDPIGCAYLWMEPADEPDIREHLPGVPLLNRVEIRADHRNLGHGSELIWEAERILADRGCCQVALAVRTDNFDAYRLYKRMGYQEWPYSLVKCMYEVRVSGITRKYGLEKCYVMVKTLRDNSA